MKYLRCLVLASALLFFGSSNASAASIQFNLDCTVTSTTACGAPTGFFGTVTLTDAGPLVTVTVDMEGGLLPSVLSLNWNSAFGCLPEDASNPACNPALFWTTSAGTSVLKVQTDVSGAFSRFDIALWDTAAPLTDPWVFSLGHASIDLDVFMFFAKDDQNALWAAVLTGTAPAGSSTNANCTTNPYNCVGALTAVPEPGTLVLVGLGLLTAASAARRRMRKNVE